jgi:hypothetical protein
VLTLWGFAESVAQVVLVSPFQPVKYTVELPEYFQTTYAHEQPKLGAPDAAAARLTKLSITGATQTVPPTITPALRRLRREIGELIRLSSALDSSDMSPSRSRPNLPRRRPN